MARLLAIKFARDEMPVLYEPGAVEEPRLEEFLVLPREGTEDIGFVACFEHRSREHLKLRPEPYQRALRRATEPEVESWWSRKLEERRAVVLAKEKARELRLDIKIAKARIDPVDKKTIIHFTSEQRVDFRQLVRELSTALRMRIELWQIGVRDEARLVDGFGVCGLQTCCSTWLKEFRPISIRMAKEQDINLPPGKLSGQCGRLLCCLSYEVDSYRLLSKDALPKGATVEFRDAKWVVIDRNLVGRSYLLSDGQGAFKWVKAAELDGSEAKVPEKMTRYGKEIAAESRIAELAEDEPAAPRAAVSEADAPRTEPRRSDSRRSKGDGPRGGRPAPRPEAPAGAETEEQKERRGRRGRKRGRGEREKPREAGAARPEQSARTAPEADSAPREAASEQKGRGPRPKKRGRRGGRSGAPEGGSQPTGEARPERSERPPDAPRPKPDAPEGGGEGKPSGRPGRRKKRRK